MSDVLVDADATVESLERIAAHFEPTVREVIRSVVLETQRFARATTLFRDRTTQLRKSILGVVFPRELYGIVEAQAPHALYVEEGTRAHEIRPKEGYGFVGPLKPGQSRRDETDIGTHRVALRWFDNPATQDGVHFARVVHKKKQRGRFFMRSAGAHGERFFVERAESALDSLFVHEE